MSRPSHTMQQAQSGFIRFINQTQMASFGSFAGEVRWAIVSFMLLVVSVWLLTRRASEIPYDKIMVTVAAETPIDTAKSRGYRSGRSSMRAAERSMMVSSAVSVFLAHNTAAEAMRQVGLYLAIVLVSALTGKSFASFWSQKNVRETAAEYGPVLEAKERGRATGKEIATKEHAALKAMVPEAANPMNQMNIGDDAIAAANNEKDQK